MSNCIGPTNIIPNNNQVVLVDVNKTITIIDNNCCTTVDVTQPVTSVVQVLTGPIGAKGEFPTSGSFNLTGSINVSGSISSDYFYGGIFSGSFIGNFSGSTSNTLQDVTDNGSTTTHIISASGLNTNALNVLGDVTVTGSLTVSSSNTLKNIGPTQFTGSVDILGNESLNGTDGYIFLNPTILNPNYTIQEVHTYNDLPWMSRLYNDSFSTSSAVMSWFGWNDGRFVFHSDTTQSIGIQVNGYGAENGLLIYQDRVAFVNNIEITGSATSVGGFTGSLFGTASYTLEALSSSYALTSSYIENAQTASYVLNAISSSYALTASYAQNASAATLAQTASYVTLAQTASYVENAQTASYIQTAQTASYVLNAVSASYSTTSSYSNTSTSASYALTASYAGNVPATASYALQALSSSYASTASYVQTAQTASYVLNAVSSSYAATASYAPNYLPLTGGTINGDVTVNGTASVTFLHVTYESSSVIYSSGSNQFGDATDDTQTLIGTTKVSGSFEVTGSTTTKGSIVVNTGNIRLNSNSYFLDGVTTTNDLVSLIGVTSNNEIRIGNQGYVNIIVDDTQITGSLSVQDGITGSLLGTASYANQALSSSYTISSSYALSSSYASTASYVQNAQTASYVLNAVSSSYVLSSSYAISSSNAQTASYYGGSVTSASYALTASYAMNGGGGGTTTGSFTGSFTGSLLGTASYADQALSSSYASNAQTASYIDAGNITTGTLNNSRLPSQINVTGVSASLQGTASWASQAVTASYIVTAQTASYVLQAISASYASTASYIITAQTASYVLNAVSASYVTGSIHNSTNPALSASYAVTASYVQNAQTASYVLNAISSSYSSTASYADQALSSSYAVTASYLNTLNQDLIISGNLFVTSSITASVMTSPTSSLILTPLVGSIGTGSVQIQGGLEWKRTTSADAVEIGDLISFGGTMGIIDGGTLTTSSTDPLLLQVGETIGYVMTTGAYGSHNLTKLNTIGTVTESRQISFPSSSDLYVYYNNSLQLRSASVEPNSRFNILLGRVISDTGSIKYIDRTGLDSHHYSNYIDKLFRKALGPVWDSGATTTEGTTVCTLNVTAGVYYFSEFAVTTTAGTPITFDAYYRTGSAALIGGSAFTASYNQVTASNTLYDSASSGVLQSIPSGKYVKHAFYVLGRPSTKYLMVYGQDLFDNVEAAEAGSLPTPPSFIKDQFSIFASIVVTPDSSSIQSIVDERPRIGFASPSRTGVVTLHANLLGLTSDDHPQYLLVDGTRAMSGDLSLDGNDITNVATINATSVTASFNGNLTGTADTASFVTTAQTASYVQTAQTASYVQLAQTASYVLQAVSSSFASTASFVSLAQTASYATNLTVASTLTLDESLTDFAKVNSTIVGANNLFTQATGSYTSAIGKYTVYQGTNSRAGEFMTSWNGTTTTYTDTSTTDIGNTSDITITSAIVSSNIQINAVAGSSGWTVKMLITYL